MKNILTLGELLADETMTPQEKYHYYINKSAEWKQIRKIILERDNYHCMCCGRDEDDFISGKPVHLTVHHNSYRVIFQEKADLSTLTTLC